MVTTAQAHSCNPLGIEEDASGDGWGRSFSAPWMRRCNPLGIEEDASGVGSEGSRKTSTYRAVCAGVGANTLHKCSRPEIAVCLFLLTPKNTTGFADARGSGGRKAGGYPPAQMSNSTPEHRILYRRLYFTAIQKYGWTLTPSRTEPSRARPGSRRPVYPRETTAAGFVRRGSGSPHPATRRNSGAHRGVARCLQSARWLLGSGRKPAAQTADRSPGR